MKNAIVVDTNSLVWKMPPGVKKSSQDIEISNPTPDTYAFKVKSTSRSRFIVKPSFGLIKPFKQIKIQILVDLTKQEDTRNPIKDKFNIFSLKAPESGDDEAMDSYIKQNQAKASSLIIVSSIEFHNPNVFDSQLTEELVEKPTKKEMTENEVIYRSLVREPKPDIKSQLTTGSSTIYTSIVPTPADQKQADSVKEFGQHDSIGVSRVVDTQIQMEDPEKIQQLKKRIFSLEEQLKHTVVC